MKESNFSKSMILIIFSTISAYEYEYWAVARTKSTAFGKKCGPSRGTRIFSTEINRPIEFQATALTCNALLYHYTSSIMVTIYVLRYRPKINELHCQNRFTNCIWINKDGKLLHVNNEDSEATLYYSGDNLHETSNSIFCWKHFKMSSVPSMERITCKWIVYLHTTTIIKFQVCDTASVPLKPLYSCFKADTRDGMTVLSIWNIKTKHPVPAHWLNW